MASKRPGLVELLQYRQVGKRIIATSKTQLYLSAKTSVKVQFRIKIEIAKKKKKGGEGGRVGRGEASFSVFNASTLLLNTV